MRIDLHSHSTASDGSFSPSELVDAALAARLNVLALTDHDTFKGLREFSARAAAAGLRTLSGVEFSVGHEDGSLHLLGYGFDPDDPALNQKLIDLAKSRDTRNENIVRRLNELGFGITFEDVLRFGRNGVVGRLHIAAALVEAGAVSSYDEAFNKLIGSGKPAYAGRMRLTLAEACALLHQAGGVAVWAHPGTDWDKLPKLIERLPDWKNQGLDGVESDYGKHSTALRDMLRGAAKSNGLIYTGGSDFHGTFRPGVKLGDGPEGSPVGEECYEMLVDRISKVGSSRN